MKATKQIAIEALQPLVDYCKANRGAIAEVARRVVEKTGETIPRTSVARWLAKVESDRTEPLFGVGLVLLEIAGEMIPAKKSKNGKYKKK